MLRETGDQPIHTTKEFIELLERQAGLERQDEARNQAFLLPFRGVPGVQAS